MKPRSSGVLARAVSRLRPLLFSASLALVTATCMDFSGPDPESFTLEISGPDSVRVADSIRLAAVVPGVSDLAGTRIRWTASDPSRVRFDSVGATVSIEGLELGDVDLTATLYSGDLATPLSQTRRVVVRPGAPSRVVVVTAPTSAEVGRPLTVAPSVRIADVRGNPVSIAGQQVSAELVNGVGTVTAGTAVTGADGTAQFPTLTLVAQTGTYRLRFVATGLRPDTTAAFALSAGAATKLTLETAPSATAAAGAPLSSQPRLQLRDAGDNPVSSSGIVVRARATGVVLAGDSVVTNSAGVAQFTGLSLGGRIAAYPVSFVATLSGGNVTAGSTPVVTLTAGEVAALAVVRAPSPTAQSGVAFSVQPTVQLQDAFENAVPLSNVTVTASLAAGAGTLAGASVATDASGLATFTALSLTGLVGNTPQRVLAFSVAGGSIQSSPATVELAPGQPSVLRFRSAPSASVAGVALSPVVEVGIEDAAGNLVTGSTNAVQLALGTNPTGATLANTTLTNAVAGVARFSDLRVDRAAAGYTLTATSAGLTTATSDPFTVAPGAASRLRLSRQPSTTALAGAVLATQPTIQVEDAFGNAVPGVRSIAVSLAPATGTLGGTTTVATDGAGTAVWSDLVVNGVVGTYTLTFAASGLQSTTSSDITLAAGAAARLAFRVQPSTTTAGTALAPALEVEVQDAAGNRVTSGSSTVTLSLATNPGAGALSGSLSGTTSLGVATFSNVSLATAASGYALRATAPGLAEAVSTTFTVTAGAASQLVVITQPAVNSQSGVPLSVQPVVQVRDAFGNAVEQVGRAVTVSIGSGAATLGGTTTVNTAGTGAAAFTDLVLSGAPTSVTLSFASAGLPSIVSNSIALSFGAPYRLAFTAQPTAVISGAAMSPAVRVAVLDSVGNAVPTATPTVTLTLGTNPGGATLANASATATGGIAEFSALSLDKAAAGYRLTASATGLLGATSDTFTVRAAIPAQLVAVSELSQSDTVGAAVERRPSVRITDASGNGVPNVAVRFTVTGGGGSLTDSIPVTDASGTATVGSWILGTLAGGNTVTATSAALPAITVTFTATGTPGPAAAATSTLVLSADSVRAGSDVVALLTTRDAYGNALTTGGAAVTFERVSGTSTGTFGTVADSANGRYAVLFTGNVAGTATTIRAKIAGVALGTSAPTVRVYAGAPARLTVVQGAGQSMMIGSAVTTPPAVRVSDAFGNAVRGVSVSFSVTLGAGSILPTTAVTSDSVGVAGLSRWVLGLSAGGNRVRVTADSMIVNVDATATVPTVQGSPIQLGNALLGADPAAIAADPSLGQLYVTSPATNEVSILATPADTAIARIGIGGTPGKLAVDATGHRAFVGDNSNGRIVVISGTSRSVVGTIALGGTATDIAFNAKANRLYVTVGRTLLAFDGSSFAAIRTVGFDEDAVAVDSTDGRVFTFSRGPSFSWPNGAQGKLMVDSVNLTMPDSWRVYGFVAQSPRQILISAATRTAFVIAQSEIYPVNLTTLAVGTTIQIASAGGVDLTAASIHDDGATLHVLNTAAREVLVIDVASRVITDRFALDRASTGVASSGGRLFLTNRAHRTVTALNRTTGSVSAIIDRVAGSRAVAVHSGAGKLYVSNSGSNNVSVLDAVSGARLRTINVGNSPLGIAVNPKTNRVFVANRADGTISVIDTQLDSVIATTTVGSDPEWVVVDPVIDRVFVNSSSLALYALSGTSGGVVGSVFADVRNATGMAVDTVRNRVAVATNSFSGTWVVDGRTLTGGGFLSVIGSFPQGVGASERTGKFYTGNNDDPGLVTVHDSTFARTATLSTDWNVQRVIVEPTSGAAFATDRTGFRVISGYLDGLVYTIPYSLPWEGQGFGMAADGATRRIYVVSGSTLIVVQN